MIFQNSGATQLSRQYTKKGSKSEVKNYRGISLLCIMGKIFTKVLNNRLTRWADINGKIDESQGAYRTGRSTADHIFSLHAMIQRYLSQRGGRFYVAFIDFSCAFDSIPPIISRIIQTEITRYKLALGCDGQSNEL